MEAFEAILEFSNRPGVGFTVLQSRREDLNVLFINVRRLPGTESASGGDNIGIMFIKD